jgi:hypothetical protein
VIALLDGTIDEVQEWGRRQAEAQISCRDVITGRSPSKARQFVAVALTLVHRAMEELTAEVRAPDAERAYLNKHLHEAVSATVMSPWMVVADDARAAVALELAQRCRSIPLLNGGGGGPWSALPLPDALRRSEAAGSVEGWPTASPRLVAFIEGAVLEDLTGEPGHDEYLTKLQRLQHGFGLNIQELTRLLHVSRTSVQKWLAGGGISRDVQARIDEQLNYLARMESHWRPGLLPSIVRRRGRGLRGRTPLQLILAGKSDEVLEYFDSLSDYGATA